MSLTRCPLTTDGGDQCVLEAGHFHEGGPCPQMAHGEDEHGRCCKPMSLHEVCPYCSGQIEDPAGSVIPCSHPDCARWYEQVWSCNSHTTWNSRCVPCDLAESLYDHG